MYEAEVNRSFDSVDTLPPDVVSKFTELTGEAESRTTLPWGEHCTECSWPTCYTTCELYSPREDLACRLFAEGMVRIDYDGGPNPYLLKIRFKRWGKLWAIGNLALHHLDEARRREKANSMRGAFARGVPLPLTIRRRVQTKVGYLRRIAAEAEPPSVEQPNFFVVECYNPNPRTIRLTLTIRLRHEKTARPFQTAIEVAQGFNRAKVPFAAINSVVDLSQPFEVEVVPNDCENTVLYFGLMDFVRSRAQTALSGPKTSAGKTWKCIVWDLDNTLWDGTLIEDGADGVRVRQALIDVIKETDRRGILHSVASKNNPEDAMKILRMCGIDEYFLHPQIHWQPKSQSVAKIAHLLNIGLDSVVFIDDQPFEREEVRTTLPEVTVIDATHASGLSDLPECQVPVTEESRQRRSMYRQQQQREAVAQSFGNDYRSFLRECNIQIEVRSLSTDNLERVYELAQRTNQMNFSGNRYPREKLDELMRSAAHANFVIHCSDRYGSYGIVGFAVVDVGEPRLLDLMFSCRIQGKHVEHEVLGFLLEAHVGNRQRDFFANYRKTAKNEAAAKVFSEMGFEVVETRDGVSSLIFPREQEIPREEIITLTDSTSALT
jgi:FkbH-like protein